MGSDKKDRLTSLSQAFRRNLLLSVAIVAAVGGPSQGEALPAVAALAAPPPADACQSTLPAVDQSTPQTGVAVPQSSPLPGSQGPSTSSSSPQTGSEQQQSTQTPTSLGLTAPLPTVVPTGPVLPPIVPPNSTTLTRLPDFARRLMQVPTQLNTPFLFQPVISLIESGTDNVNGTGTGDLISTIALNLNLLEQTRYTQLAASGSVNYQSFYHTSNLNNGGVSGSGSGSLILWRDVLSIDGNGAVSDQFTDQFDVPATNRATNQPRVRLTSFDAGPHVTANIGNLFDLDARARYAQVDFQSLGTTVLPAGLTTAHINQALGRISTSQYIRPYQMVVSGEVLTQDGGFELYNGLYSLFLGSPESFQLVGRVGYESTFDPGVTDVKGLIWSGGFVAHPGTQGYVRVEFGSRYHKPTWDARILYPITPSILITGTYLRSFETQQTRVQRSLTGITDLNIDQPFGTPGLPAAFISPDLIGATFLSDDASLALDWRLNQTTSVQIVGAYTHRHVLTDNTDDRSYATSISANRTLNSKLRVLATFGVDKALSVRLGGLRPWDYRASVSAEYTLTKQVTASLTLARTEIFDSGSAAPSENVAELTLVRSF